MKTLRTLIAAAALMTTIVGPLSASLPIHASGPASVTAPAADKGSDGQETHG